MTARVTGSVTWSFTVDLEDMSGDDFAGLNNWDQQEEVMQALIGCRGGLVMALDAGSEEVEVDVVTTVNR